MSFLLPPKLSIFLFLIGTLKLETDDQLHRHLRRRKKIFEREAECERVYKDLKAG